MAVLVLIRSLGRSVLTIAVDRTVCTDSPQSELGSVGGVPNPQHIEAVFSVRENGVLRFLSPFLKIQSGLIALRLGFYRLTSAVTRRSL